MPTISKENYGRPTCPDIEINPEVWGSNKPQACEEDGNWYYNWYAAMKEAEYTGLKLPTIDELMECLKDKETINSIKYTGYRGAGNGEFYEAGDYANVWSSSPGGGDGAHCAVLKRGNAGASRVWDFRGRGMSLRFFSESDSSPLGHFEEITINGKTYILTPKE